MATFGWIIIWLGIFISLAYHRATRFLTTVAIGIGLIATTCLAPFSWFTILLLWILLAPIVLLLHQKILIQTYVITPLFKKLQKQLPPMSETEQIALEAGTVSWEAELFSGNPLWEKLMTLPTPTLSLEEQHFLEGPTKQLCEMINDWHITHQLYDLPETVWQFLKENGFFALIIPKQYGGKGFSAFAHAQCLSILASRSLTLASTVAVPNSLGPAELLLQYGTQEQKEYYLPRLAKGIDIPCFALTGPEAGSDAGAIPDYGIICKGAFEGKTILGIKLQWNKRYITLAPIATLLGLAFKLFDPDQLLGDQKTLGITCALIPTHTPGVHIGRRHLPSNIPFQNGPTTGKDVFIPLDWIIGGPNMVGQGWKMLVECLSCGRAISLPSISTGGAKMAACVSSAYSVIRQQFRTPISQFEGIQEILGRIGGWTYLCEATRNLTLSMIGIGEKPTVAGAISKYHVTELGRKIALDAMDLHGGKAIMMGPQNYLGRAYQGAPISITVEGANILTRNMIIFGQGAIRCHPYLLKIFQALKENKEADFAHFFIESVRSTLSNTARAWFHALTFSYFAKSPQNGKTKRYFQQLAHASSAFACVTDVSLGVLGGKLKVKEALSAKLGDLLSMLYLLSALLKHYQDQGAQETDLPLLDWACEYCLGTFWQSMETFLHNFPQRPLAWLLKLCTMPLGKPCSLPQDRRYQSVAQCLTTPHAARARLLAPLFIAENPQDSVAHLEKAFHATFEHAALLKKVYAAVKRSTPHPDQKKPQHCVSTLSTYIAMALEHKVLSQEEAKKLCYLDKLYQTAIAVDDFSPQELAHPAST